MKKTLFAICALLLVTLTCLGSCFGKKEEQSATSDDGFYAKTPSSQGDGASSDVIEIQTEKKTYEGDGDIHVMATVGFGHLPGSVDFGDSTNDFLRVECVIIEAPWSADKRASWENISEYEGSWSDEKYNSTEKDGSQDGEFYPTFKDTIELVFPVEVEKGYLEIRLYNVFESGSISRFRELRVYFEHKDGVLTLDP